MYVQQFLPATTADLVIHYAFLPADGADANGGPAVTPPAASPSTMPAEPTEWADPAEGLQLDRRNSFDVSSRAVNKFDAHTLSARVHILRVWF